MSIKRLKKVFVAISGGVDSSVAAALLQQRNFDVVAVHIKCYNVDGCGERDAKDARRVAEQLGIPFYVFDFEKEYKERVVNYMIDGYRRGLTPNPDVMCNKEIKFGLFLERALALGADYVATGHYTRLKERKGFIPSTRFARPATRSLVLAASPLGVKIKRADRAEAAAGVSANKSFSLSIAKDKNKDQSYFLWTLTQEQLQYCLFPIGDYTKPQVRRLAKKFGLLTAEKKDSQGICFLGKVTLADFLKDYIPEKRGAVLNSTGQKIGEHKGAYFYTIGQRHGFTTRFKNNPRPHYITQKNVRDNSLVVVEGEDNPVLFKKKIFLTDVNLIDSKIMNLESGFSVYARVRYRQPLAKATLHKLSAVRYKLMFDTPQKFVASGQSAVFYTAQGKLLGGGIIT